MSVRAAVAGQAGEHQAKAAEQFSPGAEGAADAGNAGTLPQGDSGRNVEDFVDVGFRGLGDASAGIGGQGFEIAPGAFGIDYAER